MQPFVLQYGRVAVDDRRRMRRIATDRPATDAVVVRVIMIWFWFLPAQPIRWRSLRSTRHGGHLTGPLVDGSVSGAGAE